MRVVLSTFGSRGDVEPMVGLAVRLRELGAEARMCAPPDFAELLEHAGLPLTPVGWPIRPLATGLLTGKVPKTLPEITAELTAMAYEAVTAAAQGSDVVVAAGVIGAQAGARAAAEKLGIRNVGATFSTNFVPSPYHRPIPWPGQVLPEDETDNLVLWDLNATHIQSIFGDPVDTYRASIGLPPTGNVRDHILGEHPFLAADPVLGPWRATPTLDVAQTGAWIRPDERPLPADLEAFLEAGAPPVYVGFGSMPMADGEVARAVIEAVRAHDRRVVLASGWADLARIDDRDDCHVVGEVNQQSLFPRVAAVVHHGGAGTTTTAARAGAPQVIVPQVADQPYWASRVTELGIGTGHDGRVPTAESLSAALGTVLDPEVGVRARAVAGTIRTDGTTVAAKLLFDAVT